MSIGVRITDKTRLATIDQILGIKNQGSKAVGPMLIADFEEQLLAGTIGDVINAIGTNGGRVYTNKAAMDADLSPAANSSAWVIGDPVAANNGIYQKQGISGSGSWMRVADLPYGFVFADDAGAGTPNAIQATTQIPISPSALVWMNIFETNGPGPTTVQFNGSGPVYTIKTNTGNDPASAGLPGGMIIAGKLIGSTFRLLSDQVSAAIVAAAEAAQAAAEAAASAVLDGRLPLRSFGPITGPNHTSTFAAAIASGKPFYVPKGNYYCDPLAITTPTDIELHPEAQVFLRSVSTVAGSRSVIFSFSSGASGSKLVGGVLDGQRSVFEGTYPNYGRTPEYVTWEGVRLDYCAGFIMRGVKFKNFVTMGFRHAGGDYLLAEHCSFENSGEAYLISYAKGCTVRDFRMKGISNGTTPIFQHGTEIRFLTDSLLDGLLCEDFAATSSGLEPIPIAISFNSCHRTTVRNMRISRYAGNVLSIGFIWNAMEDCILDGFQVSAFEIGASFESPVGGTVSNGLIDGEFVNISGQAYAGLQITIGGVFAAAGSGLAGESVGNQGAQNTKMVNCVVRRSMIGIRSDAPNISFVNVDAIGNRRDGWQLVESAVALQSHPAPQRRQTRSVVLQNCKGIANGYAGLIATGGSFYKILFGIYDNNGQDAAAPYRAGIYLLGEVASELNNIEIIGNSATDDQGFTSVAGVSYSPGNTDADNCYWFRLLEPYRVEVNQTITIVGAGTAGANLTGRIVDREVDDVKVKFSSAQAILAGANTLNIGTGSSAGSIVTGVASTWLTTFKFANYLKHPTLNEYRLISYVNSNTQLVLDSAFSAPIPPGSALVVVRANLQGVRSQQQGILVAANVLGPVKVHSNTCLGNASADLSFAFPALAAVDQGSDFEQVYSTNLNTASDTTTMLTGIPFGYAFDWIEVEVNAPWVGFNSTNVAVKLRENGVDTMTAIANWTAGFTAGAKMKAITILNPGVITNGQVSIVFSGGADNIPSGGSAILRVKLRKVA